MTIRVVLAVALGMYLGFAVTTYLAAARINNPRGDDRCVVCYSSLRPGPSAHQCDGCKHLIHVKCLAQWLEYTPNCPYCRRGYW